MLNTERESVGSSTLDVTELNRSVQRDAVSASTERLSTEEQGECFGA